MTTSKIEQMKAAIVLDGALRPSRFFSRDQRQCWHSRWCAAFQHEPHAELCPTQVLGMSAGDVVTFFEKHCHVEATFADEFPKQQTSGEIRFDLVMGARGEYDGRTASTSLYSDSDENWRAVRWLVEELLIHEKLETPRE
jgi:hypothetical protein